MTTVTCNLIEMACDSLGVFDGNVVSVPKVFEIDGTLVGVAGDYPAALRFVQWLEQGARPNQTPEFKNDEDDYFSALQLTADGIFLWDQKLARMPMSESCYAIGSGATVALYCMRYRNMSAAGAIEEAARMDVLTRPPVQTFKLPGRAARKRRKK